MEVTVIRSAKRRKTAQARMVDGVLEVRIPGRASRSEEARLVEQFRRRFERAATSATVDLAARARRLARAHDLPRPSEIRWVTNQAHRWGSCTPATGVIRITDRLASVPPWVLDHVIVHELAHLVEPGHGPRFAALVARYPLAERAEGYLLALAGGTDPDLDPMADDLEAGPTEAIPLGPGDEPAAARPPAPDRRSRPPVTEPSLPFPDRPGGPDCSG